MATHRGYDAGVGRRYVRDGAVGLAVTGVAVLAAETMHEDSVVVLLLSCVASCTLAVAIVEVPGVVRRRVEALQEAMFAEVAARLRQERKRRDLSREVVVRSTANRARVQGVGALRELADAGRVLQVRLGDGGSADLGDPMARAVAFWERRARWALRGHRVEWGAFGGAAGQNRYASTVEGARDSIAEQVRLLLWVADELDNDG